jgi:hypothetical protein
LIFKLLASFDKQTLNIKIERFGEQEAKMAIEWVSRAVNMNFAEQV